MKKVLLSFLCLQSLCTEAHTDKVQSDVSPSLAIETPASHIASDVMVGQSLDYCVTQVQRALQQLSPYDFNLMPRNILKGEKYWNLRRACPEEWCSGFWPGVLWMTYAHDGSEVVRRAAEGYTEAIKSIILSPVYDHDLGFIVINSMLKGYEVTHNASYKELALRAADSLATLFNPKVGTILSWPRHVADYGGHNTIMDNMMNLELLFWADEKLGRWREIPSAHTRYYDIAVSHAATTMKHHFRKDGSCYHVAVYDPVTGRFKKGVTHQGYSDDSMWSRGQAWAIYGYTMVYRYTREKRFLRHAQKVADVYLRRLHTTSDDAIPYWDMDDPRIKTVHNGGDSKNPSINDVSDSIPKDASAACIVASALLELAQYVPHRNYRSEAESMLQDLSTERYQSSQDNVAFLRHSTGHHPAGSEIDASIVYADYYYIEALLRLKGMR